VDRKLKLANRRTKNYFEILMKSNVMEKEDVLLAISLRIWPLLGYKWRAFSHTLDFVKRTVTNCVKKKIFQPFHHHLVLAIGNPFGLGQTVSQGIISATRRDLRLSTYEGFIQTDAAINVGNSGGALINTRGELVGISTALISSDGGSEGLGFAIPSNLAKFVMTSIINNGRVIRGWMGIESTALSNELAEAFNLPIGSGILISGVTKDGPAQMVGLQRGDIILRINDMITYDARRVMNNVAKLKPGSKVIVVVLRDNKEMSFELEVGERPLNVIRY